MHVHFLVTTWLLPGYYLVTAWLLPRYYLVTTRLLQVYCPVTSWLLPGYFLVTAWLLPGYCLVSSCLLLGYFLSTAWLLPGYLLVTELLLPGYCLVTFLSSVSSKDEICFFFSCAITTQLTSTASPNVAQHAFTSWCSVSCSVNPDLYGNGMFITVYTTDRTYTKMTFGNWKREVRACPLLAFQWGGHFQKLLPRGQLTRVNVPDYWFWRSLHNFSS